MNPKTEYSSIIGCIPQTGTCPRKCKNCFFQEAEFYIPFDKLPLIPTLEEAKGRIVRVNDGNDSNHQRELVIETAMQYDDYFFNTSYPKVDFEVDGYLKPVVVTLNPGEMTDEDFHKMEYSPNIMFVRFRRNLWNTGLCLDAQEYYTSQNIPFVITYMRYLSFTDIREQFRGYYEWNKHIKNEYWSLSKMKEYNDYLTFHLRSPLTYYCGNLWSSSCSRCGNCVREYHNTKERLRKIYES